MSNKYKTTQHLFALLQKDNVEEVIKALIRVANEHLEDTEFLKLVNQTSGRYSEVKKERGLGLLSEEFFYIQRNRISATISDIIIDNSNYFIQDHIKAKPSYGDFHKIMDELAYELALNYYQVSFGETNKDIDYKKIFSEQGIDYFSENKGKKRNILIVGAGATHSSCPYVPFGKQLRMYLEATNPLYKEKMKRYGLQAAKRNSPFDPEDYLAELSNKLSISERIELRKQIHEIYNKKFLPTHTYEIIAHALKHQFIDIVINLNFDELLDEAIAEEFGKSQYIKVLNESDCDSLDKIMIDGRLKTPLYIKIHGTASAKSTLKFTKDHHKFEFPEEIDSFLRKWIRGNMKEDCTDDSCRIPANIICLGFDIERAEFYDFLIDNLKKDSKFFLINWNKNLEAENYGIAEYYYFLDSEGNRQPRHIKLETWSAIDYDGKNNFIPSMADFLFCLWNNHLTKLFKDNYTPRSLARHEIVCDVFYNAFEHGLPIDYKNNLNNINDKFDELKNYFRSTKYYFERTVLEIAITLTKNKGIIEPREAIKDERIGRFYGLYKRKFVEDFDNAREKKRNLSEYLDTDTPYCTGLISLSSIYKECFKMEERYSFSNNLLNLSPFDFENDNWDNDADFLFLKNLKCIVEMNRNSIEEFLNKPENEHILVIYRIFKYLPLSQGLALPSLINRCKHDENFKKLFTDRICANFNKIRKGFTYDITPKFLDEGLYYFESVKRKHILHTNLSLAYHFSNTINSISDWNTLLLVSERGKFISNQISGIQSKEDDNYISKLFRNKQIIIVACHEAVAEYLNKRDLSTEELSHAYLKKNQLEGSNIQIHFLPYWRHHHHMAIFLKIDKNERLPKNRALFPIDENISASSVKSIYYFKQGFSNKINPCLLPSDSKDSSTLSAIQNDQELLLDTFLAHYIKAVVYGKNRNCLAVINPDLSFSTGIGDESFHMDKKTFLNDLKENLPKI